MGLLVLLLLPAALHPRWRLGQDGAVFTDDPLKETKKKVANCFFFLNFIFTVRRPKLK